MQTLAEEVLNLKDFLTLMGADPAAPNVPVCWNANQPFTDWDKSVYSVPSPDQY